MMRTEAKAILFANRGGHFWGGMRRVSGGRENCANAKPDGLSGVRRGGGGRRRTGRSRFPAGRTRRRKTEKLKTWEPAMVTRHPGSFSEFQNFRFRSTSHFRFGRPTPGLGQPAFQDFRISGFHHVSEILRRTLTGGAAMFLSSMVQMSTVQFDTKHSVSIQLSNGRQHWRPEDSWFQPTGYI